MTTAAWAAPYHAEAFSARQGRCYRLATDKLGLPATVCVLEGV